jgi:hypothetical protein
MIEAYWWQGMRQGRAGPGGTLYLEGKGLGDAGDVVRWGPSVLPVRFRYGPHLWAVQGLAETHWDEDATFPVFIQHYQGGLTEGPPLTRMAGWPTAPPATLIQLLHAGDGDQLYTVTPGGVVEVRWSGEEALVDVGWGAYPLNLLGRRGGKGVAQVGFPSDLPEGRAAISLTTATGRLWGPPVRVER